MSTTYQSLSHTKWDCKYHVVFTPKYRKKALWGTARKDLGTIFHQLATQKGCEILEGHVMPDHVHMLVKIPPKYAVSSIIGFLKGKSTIALLRKYSRKERNFTGEHFWSRGYGVSTVGFNEEQIRKYIQEQEGSDTPTDGSF